MIYCLQKQLTKIWTILEWLKFFINFAVPRMSTLLYHIEMLANVLLKANKWNNNVLGISEIKWTGKRRVKTDGYFAVIRKGYYELRTEIHAILVVEFHLKTRS